MQPLPDTVFISRTVDDRSPLRRLVDDRGWLLDDRSLIRFEAVSFDPPAEVDWWFFYSSRAVRYAGHIPPEVRTAAIGPRTASTLFQISGKVDFCGDGHPGRTAEDFLSVAEGERVFFPRARYSRKSVQRALRDLIDVSDAVCYDNLPAAPPDPIVAGIFIFTSPLNVVAYLDSWSIPDFARVIAIGPTTAAELANRGVECRLPMVPSEAALADLLRAAV